MSKKRFTQQDLFNKGMTEVRPGVFKASAPERPNTTFAFGGKYELLVNPNTKPRMTQRDKWKKRPVVEKYYAFKDQINLEAKRLSMPDLPTVIKSIEFVIEVPKSLSNPKKKLRYGELHTQTPDLDNILKATQDSLCKEDSHIAKIEGPLLKRWAKEGECGKIIIEF